MFGIEEFDIKLETEKIGRNFIYTEEIDSTNSYLLNREGNPPDGTVVLAERQLKGRGRKDRTWHSLKDVNLTFSILLKDSKYFRTNLNLINFSAALSVAIAIENLYQLKPELKWPNDVLINGKKVSGILIESFSKGEKVERIVIGIGLNVNQNIFQGTYNLLPTSLKLELNKHLDREILLAELLNHFETLLHKTKVKPKWILNEWRNRCRMIGERISIIEGEKIITGIFDDVDDDGFLILRQGTQTQKIFSGDVSAA